MTGGGLEKSTESDLLRRTGRAEVLGEVGDVGEEPRRRRRGVAGAAGALESACRPRWLRGGVNGNGTASAAAQKLQRCMHNPVLHDAPSDARSLAR
jgi:hypothetical protein